MTAWPPLLRAVPVAAAVWVMYLAVALWRAPVAHAVHGAVTARQVFVTTMLNPKALIFGLVLLPPGRAAAFPLHLAIFAVSVLAVAAIWAGGGALLAGRNEAMAGGRQLWARRIAASWLALLSAGLAASALSH
jgi:threonine/homoserine/homoserine lactone efflux protein